MHVFAGTHLVKYMQVFAGDTPCSNTCKSLLGHPLVKCVQVFAGTPPGQMCSFLCWDTPWSNVCKSLLGHPLVKCVQVFAGTPLVKYMHVFVGTPLVRRVDVFAGTPLVRCMYVFFFVWVRPCSGTCKVFSNKLRNNRVNILKKKKKKVKRDDWLWGWERQYRGEVLEREHGPKVSKSNRAVLTL